MKKLTALIISLIMLLCQVPYAAMASSTDMRGIWVSTVTNLDFPSSWTLSAEEQKKELSDMFDQLKNLGFNTIIFQVRPCSDALYKSDINPWSKYLTGTQGKDPGYDPLQYAIEEAHERGMKLHAWLNPYRVTMKDETDLSDLAENNPARLHPDWTITYNGQITFDPAKDEVKQLVADTVKEIVQNYDVDGIHFDDYFYPSGYPLSSGQDGDGAEADERRQNVDDMIKMVSETIEEYASDVEFGVSPMGIWKNDVIDGYSIRGSQSYYTVYGDTINWIENGFIDYVVPQIYWEINHSTAAYDKLVKWWSQKTEGTGVKLYIGEGIYKDVIASEMGEHFEVCAQNPQVSGNILFRAKYVLNNQSLCDTIKAQYVSNTDEGTLPDSGISDNNSQNAENGSSQNNGGAGTSDGNENGSQSGENYTPVVKEALPTSSNIKVDGVDTAFESYNIDGYNYFKLRDIAYALNGSEKQFNTLWDEDKKSINLSIGSPYDAAGGELETGNGSVKEALLSDAQLYVDGQNVSAEAYNIDGMNYFKLRDVAKAVDFGVSWSDELNSIGIFTIAGYEE